MTPITTTEAAVALGSIRSERKAAAARLNATRPRERKPSRYQLVEHRGFRDVRTWWVTFRSDTGARQSGPTFRMRKEAMRWLLALRAKEREERRAAK